MAKRSNRSITSHSDTFVINSAYLTAQIVLAVRSFFSPLYAVYRSMIGAKQTGGGKFLEPRSAAHSSLRD